VVPPGEDCGALNDAERKAVAEAGDWLEHNQPIPL